MQVSVLAIRDLPPEPALEASLDKFCIVSRPDIGKIEGFMLRAEGLAGNIAQPIGIVDLEEIVIELVEFGLEDSLLLSEEQVGVEL